MSPPSGGSADADAILFRSWGSRRQALWFRPIRGSGSNASTGNETALGAPPCQAQHSPPGRGSVRAAWPRGSPEGSPARDRGKRIENGCTGLAAHVPEKLGIERPQPLGTPALGLLAGTCLRPA